MLDDTSVLKDRVRALIGPEALPSSLRVSSLGENLGIATVEGLRIHTALDARDMDHDRARERVQHALRLSNLPALAYHRILRRRPAFRYQHLKVSADETRCPAGIRGQLVASDGN